MTMRPPHLALALALLGMPAFAHAPRHGQADDSAPAHRRQLPLQGGQNFRDLGGYRTNDGRVVRWGLLFRSGSLHYLTPDDFARLARLPVRTVIDLRDTRERADEPVVWPAAIAPRVLTADYAKETQLGVATSAPAATSSARELVTRTYPTILARFAPQYRQMFRELLAGRVPLVVNCTAGKDRTGVASALLLTALGVPREQVIADYLLTNRTLDFGLAMRSEAARRQWASLKPDMAEAFRVADQRYIEAILAVLDRHRGGPAGYLHDEMGLSQGDIALLRRRYTR